MFTANDPRLIQIALDQETNTREAKTLREFLRRKNDLHMQAMRRFDEMIEALREARHRESVEWVKLPGAEVLAASMLTDHELGVACENDGVVVPDRLLL